MERIRRFKAALAIAALALVLGVGVASHVPTDAPSDQLVAGDTPKKWY